MLEFSNKVVNVLMGITEADIENVVVSSFECGSNYWLGLDNSKPEWNDKPKGEPVATWATKLLIEGKEIHLYDIEDNNDKWILTLEKLYEGIKLFQADKHSDKDDWDSIDADCIIQYALFSEIVYS